MTIIRDRKQSAPSLMHETFSPCVHVYWLDVTEAQAQIRQAAQRLAESYPESEEIWHLARSRVAMPCGKRRRSADRLARQQLGVLGAVRALSARVLWNRCGRAGLYPRGTSTAAK